MQINLIPKSPLVIFFDLKKTSLHQLFHPFTRFNKNKKQTYGGRCYSTNPTGLTYCFWPMSFQFLPNFKGQTFHFIVIKIRGNLCCFMFQKFRYLFFLSVNVPGIFCCNFNLLNFRLTKIYIIGD